MAIDGACRMQRSASGVCAFLSRVRDMTGVRVPRGDDQGAFPSDAGRALTREAMSA